MEVWTWNEPVLYTQQKVNKNGELKRTFMAMIDLKNKNVRQLADKDKPFISISNRGDGKYALLTNPVPYMTESMWTGRQKKDSYLMNLDNGDVKTLSKGESYSMNFSPEGKYLVWYCANDSSWYSYVIDNAKTVRLTNPETFTAWNKENDVPDLPYGYGIAGWTDGDKYVMIKDDYDIWSFDPTGTEKPKNLTVNGAKEKIQYNLMQLKQDARSFNLGEVQYMNGYNTVTKANGIYSSTFSKGTAPKALVSGEFNAGDLRKAKGADAVIYTKQSYEIFPDILFSDLSFKKSIQITHGINQQNGILWGTAELTSWVSLDGKQLEGVIYKPANFDPKKKYPLLVNFYERNAQTLYSYHMPSPGRSTIDYAFYISHDYIIFNPDVTYTDGYPGESCYNCVMPGVTKLIGEGYIDEKAIGAQGHSWGGYQVAYLATRTNMFAAIESGAPVVNMLSAYGGIRWASGMNRSFQYEHTQSRIGGTIWSSPLRYIENSPLINMDKVTTPILIMHNDADGHVPWYQGIEYFIAMRRLQKPCWLLNYCGEPHWPSTMANRIDFQKRMFQFFDHYLKKSPMPEWMKDGVPAVDKDFELGY
jgi:dipeptidyl aminopeptidase/acylaminoacyl peptidase